MADHNKPVLTSTYANFVGELDARFDDLSVGLDPAVTSATNLPVNAIRWNSALSKDQKWNGSLWVDKSSFYALGSVRFGNGTVGAPSISFSDDTTTGISKVSGEIVYSVAGTKVMGTTSGAVRTSVKLEALGALSVFGATGNDYNQSSAEVTGGGTTSPSIKPSIGFHQPSLFAGTLRMQDASRFAFYKQGATDLAQLSVSDLVADNAVFSKDGFLTTNYAPNARNPIWRFGDSQLYGISYFQGTSGYQSADSIGMHFGEASAAGSKFSFTQDGRLVTHQNIVSGVAAVHDSGQNITVNGTGTTASTAPYLTVNSRGLVAGNGSQFTSGGLLFASYRDVRTTAYIGGITMRVVNVSDVTTNPIQMEFRIGNSSGDSFANQGNAALPPPLMTLTSAGVLNANSMTTTTVDASDNSTSVATTAFVKIQSYATLNSPALTGTPTAPTAAVTTNTTQVATTAYVSERVPNLLNASGSAPMYACRAWVNFNGTGTPTIRAAGNISSITDNGVGDYTVNFITPMPDVNFTMVATGQPATDNVATVFEVADSIRTTSSVRVRTAIQAGAVGSGQDFPQVNLSIFR